MATNFAVPANNVSTTVGTAYSGTGGFPKSLVVASGTAFPTITGSQTVTVTVSQVAFAYSPTATNANYTIYSVTAISGTTLTLGGVLEGTTDRAYAVGDVVEVRVTAGTLSSIYTAVNALEVGGGGLAIGNTVTGGTNNSILYVNSSGSLADSGPTWNGSSMTISGPTSDVQVLTVSTNSVNSSGLTVSRTTSSQRSIVQFYNAYGTSSSDPNWFFGQQGSSGNFYFNSWDTTNSTRSYFQLVPGTGAQFGSTAFTTIRADGSVVPVTMANTAAANNSLFIDSAASNKLCWKDSGGILHYST